MKKVLKLGVALAITFAGFLCSHFRSKRLLPSPSSSTFPLPSSGVGLKLSLELEDDAEKTSIEDAIAPDHHENNEEQSSETFENDSPLHGLPPRSKQTQDDEESVPFNSDQLVQKDLALPTINNTSNSPRKDVATLAITRALDKETHQKIMNLKSMVRALRDREKKLEHELVGYYGLKEQQTAFMELQNRLKISSVEAKLFSLKIESLQADNRRMEAQVADYSRVVSELESARAKIKLLKRKIRTDEEQNKERLNSLEQMLKSMEDKEMNYNADARKKLQRSEELEEETKEIRRANSILQLENSELARRLDSTQILAASVLEVPEAEALQQENYQLRQENESLTQEIERIQENRCAYVEELVYLRWLNACLRYELKDFQSSPGKTIARDLNKSVSPRSKEKAKQLILEYASMDETGDNSANLMDFDLDYWSSSQNSNNTDSSLDDSSSEVPSTPRSSTGKNIYSKLKKLVLRKNNHHQINQILSMERSNANCNSSGRRESISKSSLDQDSNTLSPNRNSTYQVSRPSLDIQRIRSIRMEDVQDEESGGRNSDVGAHYEYKKLVVQGEGITGFPQYNVQDQDRDTPEKQKLRKLAEVLRS